MFGLCLEGISFTHEGIMKTQRRKIYGALSAQFHFSLGQASDTSMMKYVFVQQASFD